ncbi:hypothetical protein [Gilvimarinus sp. DA14]|uniref:hypothetical protein n=1 Tax=Gilvimarinus sp. DA14 TaxID=2956798 RepID=UPI0020B67166|nr:hypothetical protein [Gilvimarinus sp. DA14]UTF59825.1 hypothetical protein NHM04_15340 [Gilvimarinus sp. DA14]
MKKKLLPLAMLAGLAGAAGTAQAAYLNSDGLGQVLIFPYYTVNGENFTNINLVNTTGDAKAVKVRFLEGENSQEVLDFNLYLSPYDHWSGAVALSENADDGSLPWSTGDGEMPAKIITQDTSCTAPEISEDGEDFRNFAYAVDNSGAQPVLSDDTNKSLSRTREGYVEVIEMGVLSDVADSDPADDTDDSFAVATAVTHVDGVPANCDLVRNAWNGGVWENDPSLGVDAPAGGLYGYASIIDVAEGTNASYDAVAIDDFIDTQLNQATGSLLPSLAQALPISDVFYYDETAMAGSVATNNFTAGTADTVSSLFMRDTLSNDYVLDEVLNAETDWVITMPTKRFYVNGNTVTNDNGTPGDTSDDFDEPVALQPFNAPWDGSVACEHIDIEYWDREEAYPVAPVIPGEIDFSPLPPQITETPDGFQFCTEVSIMTFNGGSVLDSSENLTYGLNLEEGYEHGWAQIDLSNPYFPGESGTDREAREIAGDATTFTGLPVVGFAVQKFENGTLEGGVLSNYAGVVKHKYTRMITTSAP